MSGCLKVPGHAGTLPGLQYSPKGQHRPRSSWSRNTQCRCEEWPGWGTGTAGVRDFITWKQRVSGTSGPGMQRYWDRDFGTSGHWVSGTLGPGAQRRRYPGHGDIGMLDVRDIRTWDVGTWGTGTSVPRAQGHQDAGCQGHQDLGHWDLGHRRIGIQDTGTLGCWLSGTSGPGTLGRGVSGTVGLRTQGPKDLRD